MKVYVEIRTIGENNYQFLKSCFPTVNFVSNINESYDADAIMVEPYYVTKENIEKYTNLKWIQSYRAGFDTVDFDILKVKEIIFTNAKDVYSIPIAEDVITKILVLNRNVKTYLKNKENKEWKPNYNEPEIYNSTVGIIGMGSIAKEIAKRIKAFETKVLGYRKHYKEEPYFDLILTGDEGLNYLLKESDYVIVTVPLNDETRGLINKEKLGLMKKDAVFVNIARGDVIVQEDLIDALEKKTIRGAALDVTSPEPLPKDSKLWELENVYLTPHCSAASPHTKTRLTNLLQENLARFIEGKELVNIIK